METERSRPDAADWWNIHLFQEGTFYRAYEVSAWLCHLHISQFKVTHRHMRGIDQSVAFVGFPVSSLEKRKPEGAVLEMVEDKHVVVRLAPPAELPQVEDMDGDFAVWKSQQPLTESKDDGVPAKEARREAPNARPSQKGGPSLFGVAQQLMAYPVESHSLIECMLFMAELKRQLSGIF